MKLNIDMQRTQIAGFKLQHDLLTQIAASNVAVSEPPTQSSCKEQIDQVSLQLQKLEQKVASESQNAIRKHADNEKRLSYLDLILVRHGKMLNIASTLLKDKEYSSKCSATLGSGTASEDRSRSCTTIGSAGERTGSIHDLRRPTSPSSGEGLCIEPHSTSRLNFESA